MPEPLRIGVLASGEGTTLQAVLDACNSGALRAKVAAVISNNSGSGALRRAASGGAPTHHLSSKTHPNPAELDASICSTLTQAGVQLVLLAGFMKKLGPQTLLTFSKRIINTHPALLPKFGGQGMYGMNVHRAVIVAKERQSGATVHVVDSEYDTGPILAQCVVDVFEDDTPEKLAERVQAGERTLLVTVLGDIARGVHPLPFAVSAAAP